MITERQIKTLERETNKILAKVYKYKTYVCVSDIEVDRDLELTDLTIRLGVYKEDGQTVEQQAEIQHCLMLDLFTLKQSAALCAKEGLEQMEEI